MKILIISPSWIGDTIISHSLYRILIMKYSLETQIDVITPIWCKPIINRFTEVNKIFNTPYKHGQLNFIKCYNLGQSLKSIGYQQAIILPNSLKSALIPWLARIPIRTGWRGEMRYGLLNDLRILYTSKFPLMIQRYTALAYNYTKTYDYSYLPYPLPLPKLNIKQKEIKNILHKFNLNQHKKLLIGLCPGAAAGLGKCWPYYHYITLAIQLISYGYHIIILGSFIEQHIKQLINRSILKNFKKNYDNLIGKTSLDEAIVILAACKGIVSNDSGLMHIACALQRPTIGLYGYLSNPNCTPPLFYNSKIIRNTEKNHNIQYKYKKIKKTIYKYHDSLISITPNQVLSTLKILLR